MTRYLKLASLTPALLEVHSEQDTTLEHLMAFTVNLDHQRQVHVWDAIRSSWNKEPYQIRRMLTETSVRAPNHRTVFVGVEAYEAADEEGGVHAKLLAEYRALEEEYTGHNEFPDENDTRLGELEQEMEKPGTRPLILRPEEIAWAGAFATLDRHGELAVYRGYERPENEPWEDADVHSGERPE